MTLTFEFEVLEFEQPSKVFSVKNGSISLTSAASSRSMILSSQVSRYSSKRIHTQVLCQLQVQSVR